MNHRYTLEKYKTPSSRYTCPACGQRRRFTRYVDTQTGRHVADHVGRCDRQDSCGYHIRPRAYYQQHPDRGEASGGYVAGPALRGAAGIQRGTALPQVVAPAASYTSMTDVERSLTHCGYLSDLERFLYRHFAEQRVTFMLAQYMMATAREWPGSSVFWQIDAQWRIRGGKVMAYDPATGRRVRDPHARISWMHTMAQLPDYHLSQCLYGEHLLTQWDDRHCPVAITESEKTAIIGSLLIPWMLWMATGGKDGLTAEKLLPLRGHPVILYPDQGGYELWSRRARELRSATALRIDVCDLLEGEDKGVDLADKFMRERIGKRG